jgi:hypothetical protein
MSTITYTGIFQENRQVFSSYLLGVISIEDIRKLRDEMNYQNIHLLTEELYLGRLETMIVKRYIQVEMPLLWQWLKEMKIPFGGVVVWKNSNGWLGSECGVKFLLHHHSMEDLAFRLCYDVRMEESS